MARKGILVTDPTVAQMSRSQWVWEYMAIRKREDGEQKFQVKAMKAVLINVMGLNLAPILDDLGHPIPMDKLTEEQKESFVPMVMLAGNHHMMEGYVKQINKAREAIDSLGESKHSVPEEEFEKQAKILMEDGDMTPYDPFINTSTNQQELENMGIKTIEDIPKKKRSNVVAIEES